MIYFHLKQFYGPFKRKGASIKTLFYSWILSIFLLFGYYSITKGWKRKGKRITKVVIKSHAFLLDQRLLLKEANKNRGLYIP